MGDLKASPLHMISAIINAPRFHRDIVECPPEITERCVHLLTALGRSRELAIQTNYEVMEFLTRVVSPFDDAGYMRISRYFIQELLPVVGPQHKVWGAISYVMLSATPHLPEGDQLRLWKRINARFFEVLLDSNVISGDEEKRLKVKSVRGEPGAQPDLSSDDDQDHPTPPVQRASKPKPKATASPQEQLEQPAQLSPPEVVALLGGVSVRPNANLSEPDASESGLSGSSQAYIKSQNDDLAHSALLLSSPEASISKRYVLSKSSTKGLETITAPHQETIKPEPDLSHTDHSPDDLTQLATIGSTEQDKDPDSVKESEGSTTSDRSTITSRADINISQEDSSKEASTIVGHSVKNANVRSVFGRRS